MRKTINLSGGIVNRGNPWAVGQLPSGPSSDRSTRRCAGISTNTGRHVQELENLPLVRRSDWDNQPIVCHFIPMLFCESDQVGVCRIAFVTTVKDSNGWIRWSLILRYFSASGDKRP